MSQIAVQMAGEAKENLLSRASIRLEFEDVRPGACGQVERGGFLAHRERAKAVDCRIEDRSIGAQDNDW